MDDRLNPSSQKVQEYLRSVGVEAQVKEMPAATRTAKEAAQAIGCSVAQIAKSIVFRTAQSGRAVLVIASGANRVSEQRMSELIGEQIEKATPEFVRESTGFGIGGVPPVGHGNPVLSKYSIPLKAEWVTGGAFPWLRIQNDVGTSTRNRMRMQPASFQATHA